MKRKIYMITIWISSAARTGLWFASALAIAISNFGKRMIPPDENWRRKQSNNKLLENTA